MTAKEKDNVGALLAGLADLGAVDDIKRAQAVSRE